VLHISLLHFNIISCHRSFGKKSGKQELQNAEAKYNFQLMLQLELESSCMLIAKKRA
jgi:hypothetical protein